MKNIETQKGICLDIGCGNKKEPGFVGMDIRKLKGVDVVHDLSTFPYPFEDESCIRIIGAHVVEHINPANFGMIKFMNELWRLLKPGGQLALAYPYGANIHFQKDPTHINMCNQATWNYFDPGYSLYDVYEPLPWFTKSNLWQESGQGEVLLIKLTKEEGKNRRKLSKKFHTLKDKHNRKVAENLAKQRAKAARVDRYLKKGIDIFNKNAVKEVEVKAGIIMNREKPVHRLMYATPLTGVVRAEWAYARFTQVIPCNWSKVDIHHWLDPWSPLGYTVADARNILASAAVERDFEWIFFHDHDVVLSQGTLLKLNDLMLKRDTPVVSGIYFTKSYPSEPLIYRNKGESYYPDWKFGDKVEVSYTHMGCTLIHVSILRAMYEESPTYMVGGNVCKKIFDTPAYTWFDKETGHQHALSGTEDIYWCDRVMKEGFFEKGGWPEFQAKQFPFLCDTSIYCKHISMDGAQYPAFGEDAQFEPERLALARPLEVKNDSITAMEK